MWRKLRRRILEWRGVLITAPSVAGLAIGATSLGLLQVLEWPVHDQFFRLRPEEPPDPRIVIVTIGESDLANIKQGQVSDAVLAKLLQKIKVQQPVAIGLDLYRNLPVEPGYQTLVEVFKSTPNLIGIEKVGGEMVAPPPTLNQLGQVAAADLVLDPDGKVRRGLLTIKNDKRQTRESLGAKLALMYLESKGVTLEVSDAAKKHYRLGRAVIKPFTGNEAGYVRANTGGYQILLDYRGTQKNFHTVSMTEVLENRIDPNLIGDASGSAFAGRIVLIGAIGQSSNDLFFTPYSSSITSPKRMPGVVIHANLASQILSAALEGQPLIKSLPKPIEWLWIFSWSFAGASVRWMLLRALLKKSLLPSWAIHSICIVLAGGAIFTCSYLAFLGGWWIPVVSPSLALIGSIVAIAGYHRAQLQQENTDLEIVLEATNEHYDALTMELQIQAEEAVKASERKLAQFLDAASLAVVAIDGTGKPYFFNQRSKELLGKGVVPSATIEQLAEVYQFYIAGSDRFYPVEQMPIVRALKGERTSVDDMEIRRGGKIIPIEVWGTPIYDESGQITYAIAAFQDITERKQAQQALIQAEEKYRSIFENALEGIFQTTPDGGYLSANPALAQIYGYDSAEELMATLTNIQHQLYVDLQRRSEFLSLMEQYGAISGFESQVYRKDRSIIWISENARTVCDDNGVLLYYQGFVENITERKLAEEERQKFTNQLYQINKANERFVPRKFLQLLEKESILDVQLGDHVQLDMSILFTDIRDFTTLSEKMTPEENFKFINAYLSHMEPVIRENNGFIDKYIGDAIMALFGGSADDAVKAGIDILHRLAEYNTTRNTPESPPIQIGIGINTGSLMLGTVGGRNRMDGTVISDAVNLASRLEGLTKYYGVSLLISHNTFSCLQRCDEYGLRLIDRVKVKGKSEMVSVFEIFDADPPEVRESKLATKATFEQAVFHYYMHSFTEAAQLFQRCLEITPWDKVAQIYLERCQQQAIAAMSL
ncbi:CHASE2 domain-containing protein [Microcoleus sp. FACHB-831]|uniref:CHASE2 domain-containing protein n=1 Tax=Microcoleus sp. FACHB-831 TaxID=2692827 RepID=UPI001684E2C6|nr:CHASE2 domain-containing protein [Microcoleus sp. FACHB-831]MBD1919928.1 CHASE2 domain-containing protein [Microcoleus sp. FACHB-831]